MKTLIKMSADWADEFTAESFAIFNGHATEAIDHVRKELEQSVEDGEGYYFGTNEGWEPHELSLSDFKFEELTEQEYEIIKRVLGTSFGTGCASSFV